MITNYLMIIDIVHIFDVYNKRITQRDNELQRMSHYIINSQYHIITDKYI